MGRARDTEKMLALVSKVSDECVFLKSRADLLGDLGILERDFKGGRVWASLAVESAFVLTLDAFIYPQ